MAMANGFSWRVYCAGGVCGSLALECKPSRSCLALGISATDGCGGLRDRPGTIARRSNAGLYSKRRLDAWLGTDLGENPSRRRIYEADQRFWTVVCPHVYF